jgi:fructokinase
MAADHARATGHKQSPQTIIEAARCGDRWAAATLDRYVERLGRALAVMIDLIDPSVIVLGGGLSNVDELYARLPDAVRPHVFSDVWSAPIVKAVHGDSSGVRGAARLWPLEAAAKMRASV